MHEDQDFKGQKYKVSSKQGTQRVGYPSHYQIKGMGFRLIWKVEGLVWGVGKPGFKDQLKWAMSWFKNSPNLGLSIFVETTNLSTNFGFLANEINCFVNQVLCNIMNSILMYLKNRRSSTSQFVCIKIWDHQKLSLSVIHKVRVF